ncbi:MAG: hypothetical protein JNK63_06425 [Chthonomonas sp.]|nr:hypothetical protein [Chthonomonas sp.]
MTRFFPERVDEAMHRLFELDPHLRNELVIGAVDQEMLTVQQAADYTGMSTDEIDARLVEFRTLMAQRDVRIEKPSEKAVARVVGAGISVWEIVREQRRVQSIDALRKSFPALSKLELEMALAYANEHPDEINGEIEQYEQVLARRQAKYPFAK